MVEICNIEYYCVFRRWLPDEDKLLEELVEMLAVGNNIPWSQGNALVLLTGVSVREFTFAKALHRQVSFLREIPFVPYV